MTHAASPSTADLVRQAADQVSTLIRDEIKLAQAEPAETGRHAARGAGMFGEAGLTRFTRRPRCWSPWGLALALVMPGWLAALIVAVVLFLAAGLQALMGRNQIRRVPPLAPERALRGVQADVRAAATGFEERNHS
jgi:Putative Actinobacterial Holin-X, holin superfamily III